MSRHILSLSCPDMARARVVLFPFEQDISYTARSKAMSCPISTIYLYWFFGLESIKIASENNLRVELKNLLQKKVDGILSKFTLAFHPNRLK